MMICSAIASHEPPDAPPGSPAHVDAKSRVRPGMSTTISCAVPRARATPRAERAKRASRCASRAIDPASAREDAPSTSRRVHVDAESAPRRRAFAARLALAALAAPCASALSLIAPTSARAAPEDAGDWSSPGLRSTGDAAKYVKTPSGLVYEDVNQGEGEPAVSGDIAVFEYVMRRANGYFIYGTIDCGIGCGNGDPYEAKLGPSGQLIPGLDELLTGMRPGGKRKALIKPELAYRDGPTTLLPQPPEYGQRRQIQRVSSSQQGEPLIFEVRLIKTRKGA